MRTVWAKECSWWIHRKKLRAVRGWGLRSKREERREGFSEGIRVLREGLLRHSG